MTEENLEEFYSRISAMKTDDIEAHCRAIHADAVVFSFTLVFSALKRLLQRLIHDQSAPGEPAGKQAA